MIGEEIATAIASLSVRGVTFIKYQTLLFSMFRSMSDSDTEDGVRYYKGDGICSSY